MKLWIHYSSKNINWLFLTSVLVFFIFLQNFSAANGQSVETRPRIGLSLSGGGACGIAHVGVLKVMEEAGLRPDYIAGVSMGSLLGGLYALGYSADSLEKLCKEIDWDLIISNQIPESKIIFNAKNHYSNSIVALPVTFKRSMIPTGLINGQQIENMLSYYYWPAAGINDFSKLPIPYMCLATNLVTCKKVELTSGYLPDAVRASIAVPTIFTPLKIDSLLLVDGGMVRNFAVSEVRNMGADIVIGSYTGSYMSKKEELQTVTDVLAQLLFFVGVYDYHEQKKLVDILIEPKTDDLPSTDFSNVDTLIQRGYKAALPYKSAFKKLADSINRYGPEKPVNYLLGRQLYTFDSIEIMGNKRISDKQILGVLHIRPGEQVSKKMMKDKIDLLYGNGWFDKVKYRIESDNNNSLILKLDCIEEPKMMLYGSVHYDDAMHSGLVLSLTVKNPVIQRSLLDINTYIGHYYMAGADYWQFIDRSQKYSLSANFFAENTYIPRFELDNETGGTFNRNFYQGLSLNKRMGLNHMISAGVELENMNLVPDYISGAGLKTINTNYLSETLEYRVNTLNTKHFPEKGIEAQLSIRTSKMISGKIMADSILKFQESNTPGGFSFKRFISVNGSFRKYINISGKWTIGINGAVLYISDTDSASSRNNYFFLGGTEPIGKRTIPMTGFHSYQIPVRNLAGAGLSIDYKILSKVHLNLMSDLFAAENIEKPDRVSFLTGIGLGAGYMTLFGPVKVGIMYGNYDREKYFKRLKGYISLGFSF